MRQIWVLASANVRRDSGGVGGEPPEKESWGRGCHGQTTRVYLCKNLHWPMSNYNFNIGYNLTFVYFGRQLVAVKARYFLQPRCGPT